MSGFYSEEVVVYRPEAKTNRAGESELDYATLRAAIADGSADGSPRDRVRIRVQNASEVVNVDQETTVTTWRIATAPWTGEWDVLPTDWIKLPTGEIVHVDGKPMRGIDPVSGSLHHIELNVIEVAG